MVGPDYRLDPAKVELAARALMENYGDSALEKARELEKTSDAPLFAEAVRKVVEELSNERKS